MTSKDIAKVVYNQAILFKFQIITLIFVAIFFLFDKIMVYELLRESVLGFTFFFVYSIMISAILIVVLLMALYKIKRGCS